MSTRCNVVVKNGSKQTILYHHFDGYPEGVGKNLVEFMADKHSGEINDVDEFVKELKAFDNIYEDTLGLHWDIEYLYVIWLDAESVVCYSVNFWDTVSDDDALINGEGTKKEQKIVYTASLFDSWGEIEREIKSNIYE